MGSTASESVVVSAGDAWEVIGFDGAPLVACGESAPVVRRASDGRFCKFSGTRAPPLRNWYAAAELDQYVAQGRISRLEKPLALPRSSGKEAPRSPDDPPVVVFVQEGFLRAAGMELPNRFESAGLVWQPVAAQPSPTWATCLVRPVGRALLDEWAGLVLRHLNWTVRPGAAEEVRRLADLGLCAAWDQELRWRLYVHYGAALDRDRVRRLFESFVQHEFSADDWGRFVAQIASLRDVLAGAPAPVPGPLRSKLRGLAAIRFPEVSLVGTAA